MIPFFPMPNSTNGIQYFSIIYKQFDAMVSDFGGKFLGRRINERFSLQLAEEVTSRMETGQMPGTSLNHWTLLEGDKEPADTRPFELYLALQVFQFPGKVSQEERKSRISSIGLFFFRNSPR